MGRRGLRGVQIHVTDRRRFRPFRTGVAAISVARRLAPAEFRWKAPPYEFEHQRLPIDILFGTDRIRTQIEGGTDLPVIEPPGHGAPLYNPAPARLHDLRLRARP